MGSTDRPYRDQITTIGPVVIRSRRDALSPCPCERGLSGRRVYRFCHGSVDTPSTGVDTVFQTLRKNDEEKVKWCRHRINVSTHSEVVSTHSG
ncbi:hypothetical protein Taro_013631 [Colocasia esculenta]|uniref:Uncharacterized protein n=1 Tax=Colocasia esculenta TaxID=4460 RepID=A0A843UG36_COLES|nr:hypothetical protein [Colocasia esculenta]